MNRIPNLIEKYGKDTLLCDLPNSEVDSSSSTLAEAFKVLGYIQSPRHTINEIGMWNAEMWKVQAFLESCACDTVSSISAQESQ